MSRKVRYPIPTKVKDCTDQEGTAVLAVTIRTTDGKDESYASKQADARGTTMTEELIRFSVVSYETAEGVKTASQPFIGFDDWSTKLRNFVVAAWKRLATPDDEELTLFFANASDVE